MTLLTLIGIAAAVPPQPAQITPSAEESALLTSGGVVFRYSPDGESLGIVDIAAPPTAVIAQVMNLTPRVDEIGPLLSLTPYEVEGSERYGARWELGAAVYSATFYVIYDCDLAAGWCLYDLDPS
ncbi:MAG: hypothetical protein ACI8RZ_003495, partial [Myxococcota bacterium]